MYTKSSILVCYTTLEEPHCKPLFGFVEEKKKIRVAKMPLI